MDFNGGNMARKLLNVILFPELTLGVPWLPDALSKRRYTYMYI